MVIEAIFAGVLVAITILNVLAEVILKFSQIIDWFRERRARVHGVGLNQDDADRVGFTLVDLMAKGQYRTVQGVFNERTRHVEAGARAIMSKEIDKEFAAKHGGYRLVKYT
jgi:hypothetical protein